MALALRVQAERPGHLQEGAIHDLEPGDGFRREELDESMATGKHREHDKDKREAFLWAAFIFGMILGATIMDYVSR